MESHCRVLRSGMVTFRVQNNYFSFLVNRLQWDIHESKEMIAKTGVMEEKTKLWVYFE